MNIYFEQVEKKSQVFSYLLITVAVFTLSMLTLNASWHTEFHRSMPSSAVQRVYTVDSNIPMAISVPLPPQEHVQMTTMPVPSTTPAPLPQAVPAPTPDVP